MLILGDEGHYHGRFPWVTASLVVINVVVYVAQALLGEPFTNGFSLVPKEIVTFHDLQGTKYHKAKIEVPGHYDHKGHYQHRYETKQFPIKHYTGPFPIFLTLFTSMFMHGDIFHLIGNMWFLLIFGRNVECAMNHGRFLAFYTACGTAAGLAHVASDAYSILPCLGASGAISGVMGAYVSIHPLNKIKVWLTWWLGIIEVPALVVIGLWFVIQYLSAFLALADESAHDNVAYWAHLGGFMAGFLILRAVVFYLQRQHVDGPLDDEEPLVRPVILDELSDGLPPPFESVPVAADPTTAVKSGAPDPFANFLAIQTEPKARQHVEYRQ